MKNLLLAMLVGVGCSGAPPVENERPPISKDDRDSILDAPVKVDRAQVAAANLARMELPDTPEAPNRDIDGDLSDWDPKAFRTFDKRGNVESGERFWRGPKDASMRVAVDSDPGYLYFAIDVTDDVVLAGDPETVIDAVVLTIRDPNLDRFVRTVPESARLQDLVKAETSLIFFPDGRFQRFNSDEVLPDNMGVIAVNERKGGYVIELALQIEAFEQVGAIPLETIAFRVDLFDGDEEDRPGTQTVYSMLPDRGADDPRMALFQTVGLLPHFDVEDGPPRKNAIGSWVALDNAWNFTSFERVPTIWLTIDDARAFDEAVRKSESVNDVCRISKKDVKLVETYESRGGGFRAGLLVCGDRPVRGKCPSNSKTEVFWLMLKQHGGQWLVEKSINVFAEPLSQCAFESVAGEEFHSQFSMFPMDMIDDYTWAVGFSRQQTQRGYDRSATGISVIHTELSNPIVGSAMTEEKRSVSDSRTKTISKVYLALVDDDEHYDFCAIEDAMEQYCSGLDVNCQTHDHGKQILTTTQLYNPRTRRFERYELSKHPGCNADFDFSERDGFLLLQSPGRIGFLPSPAMEEGEGLKLF